MEGLIQCSHGRNNSVNNNILHKFNFTSTFSIGLLFALRLLFAFVCVGLFLSTTGIGLQESYSFYYSHSHSRHSHLKIPDGPKMALAALSRRAIDGPCALT